MNTIYLNNLKLKTFTEQNTLDYCFINNININNIIQLNLGNNQLTDILGIKLLYLHENNMLTDISDLKNLTDLEILYLRDCNIFNILYLKKLIKLKELSLENTEIKDISVLKNLKNLEWLSIQNLELESDQIEYINSIKNLKTLFCQNAFKDRNNLNELNKNIKPV